MTTGTTVATPLGPLWLIATDDALVGAAFASEDAPLLGFDGPVEHHPIVERATDQVLEYFAGERCAFELPLAPRGTPFQQRVWSALCELGYGTTTTYGALARTLGVPTSPRAVGAAVGRNPIAVVIPCHRVVGSRGELTGYAGGLDRKRRLLALEGGGGQLALHVSG